MRQLRRPPQRLALLAAAIPQGTKWAGNKASKKFRKSMVEWCRWNQNDRCFYCSRAVSHETRVSKALDHIVPKGKLRGRPEWTHLPINIVLACWYCNSDAKKQENPFIDGKKSPYRPTNYDFVHPYIDNVGRHLEGGFDERTGTVAPIKFHTDKGKRSVRMFDMDSPGMFKLWMTERYRQELDLEDSGLSEGVLHRRDAILAELRRSLKSGDPTP